MATITKHRETTEVIMPNIKVYYIHYVIGLDAGEDFPWTVIHTLEFDEDVEIFKVLQWIGVPGSGDVEASIALEDRGEDRARICHFDVHRRTTGEYYISEMQFDFPPDARPKYKAEEVLYVTAQATNYDTANPVNVGVATWIYCKVRARR